MSLEKAIHILKQGGTVGMPTETVYGLASAINSEKGLLSIFEQKERPFFDPLIVHVSSLEMIERDVVCQWPDMAAFLASVLMPGPLTLILPKKESVSSLITSGLDTVGVRFPSHPLAQALISGVGIPLAAPSANKFKKTSPTTALHVRESFPDLLVLDGGPCEKGLESTIIKIEGNQLFLLRPGPISSQELLDLLEAAPLSLRKNYTLSTPRESALHVAPGQLKEHYRPNIPLYIVTERPREGVELMLDSDPCLAARQLYAQMRELSKGEAPFIYVIKKKEHESDPKWQAIWDRLERAQTASGPSA